MEEGAGRTSEETPVRRGEGQFLYYAGGQTFGRKDMGATGAAGGVERIILAIKKREELQKNNTKKLIFIVYDYPQMIS